MLLIFFWGGGIIPREVSDIRPGNLIRAAAQRGISYLTWLELTYLAHNRNMQWFYDFDPSYVLMKNSTKLNLKYKKKYF